MWASAGDRSGGSGQGFAADAHVKLGLKMKSSIINKPIIFNRYTIVSFLLFYIQKLMDENKVNRRRI